MFKLTKDISCLTIDKQNRLPAGFRLLIKIGTFPAHHISKLFDNKPQLNSSVRFVFRF